MKYTAKQLGNKSMKVVIRDGNGACFASTLTVTVQNREIHMITRDGFVDPDPLQDCNETETLAGWHGRSGPAAVYAGHSTSRILIPLSERKRIGAI
jgi:hypothetical protein